MKNDKIHFFVELTISKGNLDAFKALSKRIIALIQDNEPKTEKYQWHINSDGTKCVIHEIYPNSEVMLTHGREEGFGEFFSQMSKIASNTNFYVLGDLTEEAKKAMTDVAGNNIFKSFAGFTR